MIAKSDFGETVALGDIPALLFRRKWQTVGTFILVLTAGTLYTFLTPKQYQSHMKILVKNERADMIVSASGGDGSGHRSEVSETEINSEIELLNSSNLLRRVVKDNGLERLEKGGADIADKPAAAVERATARLQRDLSISPVRKANIIQVDYLSRDPSRAANILRDLAALYLDAHLTLHGTPGTYEFFRAQAERYQRELASLEARQDRFRRENNIVMLSQQKDAILQRATESQAALLQSEASIGEFSDRVNSTQKLLASAQPRVETQNRTVPHQYSVEHLSSMLAELENKRTQLLAKFRPDDRLVVEAEQEISDTREALERANRSTASEKSTDINPVYQNLQIDLVKQKTELAGVEARRRSLAVQVTGYRTQLMALGMATAAYDDLAREQKNAEENYVLYSRKAEEARIGESLDKQKISNVAIAESPTEPFFPSKPNVRLNLLMSFLLACFTSVGLAFGAEYARPTGALSRYTAHSELRHTGVETRLLDTVSKGSELEVLTRLPVLADVHRTQQTR